MKMKTLTLSLLSLLTEAKEIKVMTFNAFSLPAIISPTSMRNKRLDKLCDTLKDKSHEDNDDWDVILLQELWTRRNKKLMKDCGYPYSAEKGLRDRKKERFLDAGLLILSKHPIKEIKRYVYKTKAKLDGAINIGELLVKKSTLMAKIEIDKKEIWFGNTHLAANYSPTGPDNIIPRRNQFKEMISAIKETAKGLPVIVGGDFNFAPNDPLGDTTWDMLGRIAPGFQYADDQGASTYSSDNTMVKIESGHLDHILVSSHFKVHSGKVALNEYIYLKKGRKKVKKNYSDHYGWQTTASLD